MASGIPSRRRHNTPTAARLRSVSAKSFFAALARSQNRQTVRLAEIVETRIAGRDAQRRHCDHALARQPEAFPARRQQRHLWATLFDRVDQTRGRIDDMLTVVEYQQQPFG